MKIKVIILFIILVPLLGYSQSLVKYSEVSISLVGESIEELMSLGIAFDHAKSTKKSIQVIVNENELDLLKKSNFKYSLIKNDVSNFYIDRNNQKHKANDFLYCNNLFNDSITVPESFNLGGMGGYLTYDELLRELDSMILNYPNLITVKQEIDTFNTEEGRPIYFIKISDNPTLDESGVENKVLYTALHHAREPMSMMQLIFYMQYLLENYDNNKDVKKVVDNLELYFVPCINPDGYIYNQTQNPNGGGLWRKNRRDNGDGTFGVDLNRNYGYEWGKDDVGSSPITSSNAYRGSAPFSEPETRSIKFLCEKNDFKITLNYHAYSNVLLCPEGFENDSLRYFEYADIISEHNHYTTGTPINNLGYSANGDSDTWMYHDLTNKSKQYTFTPEIGKASDGFWPQKNRIIPLCKENLLANINAAEAALDLVKFNSLSDFKTSSNDFIEIELTKIGIDDLNSCNISLLNNNQIEVNNNQNYNLGNFNDLESKKVIFNYSIKPEINEGELIKFDFLIEIDGDNVSKSISRVLSMQPPSYSQKFDINVTDWNFDSWGITNEDYLSFPNSVSDSPFGNYNPNIENELNLNRSINLTNPLIKNAYLTFDAKWDTEDGFDYIQLIVNDGVNDYPMCGNYSNLGIAITGQPEGEPLYDGLQRDWINEYINLNQFIGNVITIKYVMKSDGAIQKKGFYFDNFKIYSIIEKEVSLDESFEPNEFEFFPNPFENELTINNVDNKDRLLITNLLGQELDFRFASDKTKIDLSFLKSGVYILHHINSKNYHSEYKIVKK